jgi:hypothetical protein
VRTTGIDLLMTLRPRRPSLTFRSPHFRSERLDESERVPGDMTEYANGPASRSRTLFYANDPRREPGRLGALEVWTRGS